MLHVNAKLGKEMRKDVIIMSQTWDKEKIRVPNKIFSLSRACDMMIMVIFSHFFIELNIYHLFKLC